MGLVEKRMEEMELVQQEEEEITEDMELVWQELEEAEEDEAEMDLEGK